MFYQDEPTNKLMKTISNKHLCYNYFEAKSKHLKNKKEGKDIAIYIYIYIYILKKRQ